MKNYIVLIILMLASVAIIATYDFGKPDLPYTYAASPQAVPEKPPVSTSDKKAETGTATLPWQADAPQSPQKYVDPVKKVQLELAVVAAKASAECGHSSIGYRHLKPAEAAAELVRLMNSAQQPAADEQNLSASAIKYVLGKPDAAWQVAIRADEDKKQLVIEGYATDLANPVFMESMPCQ